MLIRFFKNLLLLIFSPILGAIYGVIEATRQPEPKNWKEFFMNDFRLYLSPFSGAVNGVEKELKRQFGRANKFKGK